MSTVSYREYSGTAATLYHEFFVPTIAEPVSRELLRVAALGRGERVIDVACGTGVVAIAAAAEVAAGGSVVGVDISPDMIEVARSDGSPHQEAIEWHVGDASALPVPDGSQDVALCQMGLMFMEDRPSVLAEMHRVLAPGGRIVINTPGRIQPAFAEMERAIMEHAGAEFGAFVSTVFSMHRPGELAALLGDAGFTSVESAEYEVDLDLPGPAEFLWKYINLTPMGPLVAGTPEDDKTAMENHVTEAWAPSLVDGRRHIRQPVVLAHGRR